MLRLEATRHTKTSEGDCTLLGQSGVGHRFSSNDFNCLPRPTKEHLRVTLSRCSQVLLLPLGAPRMWALAMLHIERLEGAHFNEWETIITGRAEKKIS